MAINNEDDKTKAEKLYNKYVKLLLYTANQIVKDSHLAQDAVNEAFVKIINNLHKIEEIDCNKTKWFVVIICRNVCLNMLTKKNKDKNMLIDDELDNIADAGDLLENITAAEGVSLIMNSLNELKPEYADLLRLKIAYNYDDKQLAELLDISYENLRSRLSRARKAIKVLLIKEGVL